MATQGGVGGGGWVVFMNMGWGGGQGGSCLFIGCDVSRHHQRYLTVSLVIYALINYIPCTLSCYCLLFVYFLFVGMLKFILSFVVWVFVIVLG